MKKSNKNPDKMEVNVIDERLQKDVESIQRIPIIPKILDVICRTTGLGLVAVARVTDEKWITCSVLDKLEFGLVPGDELKLETTICHEIRQSGKPVVINDVAADNHFCNHPTPAMYGFRSYISVPILRKDGTFFGTLCGLDPKPANLNTPEVVGMFNLFSDLISFHLQAAEEIENSELQLLKEREDRMKILEKKNAELKKMNQDLEAFAYVAGHDLQEPLRKIETFTSLIHKKDYQNLSETAKNYFDRIIKSVTRMQALIRDLLTYSQVKGHELAFKNTSLLTIVNDIQQSFSEEISQKHVKFIVGKMCTAPVIPFQMYQLLQNLVSNSIKFRRHDIPPVIEISSFIEKGNKEVSDKLSEDKEYCHITVADNGIGFEAEHNERIFKVFQRLNGREEYDGTGIGLSIVQKIVDNHGGFIAATAEVNKGARFDIYIPAN
ncbi:GAF domain-containing sensor histidine kinase [Segetibacter aerophilus]|uniref:histidine kinase n=1 Tax=Segetibacter aerophilus TaxID=670293 RepID=A0A512BCH2_9BACT|nr:ATP-binding protein [Segetibacter aerophilus]GEO09676.1 sensor histidine kinase [Segetibacter aerophilus]